MPATEQSVICFIFKIPKYEGTVLVRRNSNNTVIILGFGFVLVWFLCLFLCLFLD